MRINDILFEPDCSEEILEKGRAFLLARKSSGGTSFAYVSNFAVFNSAGEIEERVNQACHSAISGTQLKDRCLVATVNGRYLSNSGLTAEEAEPFLRWFLYESYMGRFILNRDDFEFCRDYGFLVSADVYTPLMQNVLITTRHFYECGRQAFIKFNELVASGVRGDLAYIVCFLSGWSYKGSPTPTTVPPESLFVCSMAGHRAICVPRTLAELERFMSGEAKRDTGFNDKAYHYRVNREYNGGAALFYKKYGYGVGKGSVYFPWEMMKNDKVFVERLREYRAVAPEDYKPPNPFAPAVPGQALPKNPGEVTYAEMFEVVVPYLTETIYHG